MGATLDLFAQAATRRDRGIDRAGRRDSAWTDWAAEIIRQHARNHETFLIEDVHEYAIQCGLPAPVDGRAWGAATRLAAKRGYIVKAGYAPAKSSNLSPKVLWRRA